MKIFKIVTLGLLIFLSTPMLLTAGGTHQALRHDLCQDTYNYYSKNYGSTRDWNEYRVFMYSAYRVSKMFPVYPAKGDLDRMLLFYEIGQLETRWQKNFAVVNVPNARYKNGEMKVNTFSTDYTAWGLNEINVHWTYETAKRIQQGRPVQSWLPSKTKRELAKVKIPKDLKLNRIDISIAKAAKKKYLKLVALGWDANKIRKSIKINRHEEETQDEIDSALIYRIIVETDRRCRGWIWGIDQYNRYTQKADRRLYHQLSKKVVAHNRKVAIKNVNWHNMTMNPFYAHRGLSVRES